MTSTNSTKLALEVSLKKLLLTKTLDKITINDLTADCGISRMAFYYHFRDIYDLVEWICGRKECARFLRQSWRTSPSSKMYTAASAGRRLKATCINLPTVCWRMWWRKSVQGTFWRRRIRISLRSSINMGLWASCWIGSDAA